MTATIAFQEIERGSLRLDSTIGEVLPGLWPGREGVTLGHLLNHTSGMPDAVWAIMGRRSLLDLPLTEVRELVTHHYSAYDLVQVARGEPWWFEPGTNWGYSNTGYVVAGLMIEAVSGQPLSRLIRNRVFKPAGMHRARLEEGTLVRGAGLEDAAVRPGESMRLQPIDQSIFAGAGAVIASAGDVVRFYQSLMRGHLVNQSSVDMMIKPVGAAQSALYGYGIFTTPDPSNWRNSLYGHDGAGFGSSSLALVSRNGEKAIALAYAGRPYWSDGIAEVWRRHDKFMESAFATVGETMIGGVGFGASHRSRATIG